MTHNDEDRAPDPVVRSYLDLVDRIAGERCGDKLPREQLIAVGRRGLLEAARQFYTVGGRVHFRVFAEWFIRASVTRAYFRAYLPDLYPGDD